MSDLPPDIAVAARAVRGDYDPETVRVALGHRGLAPVLATAPGVHPVVHALAALGDELVALLEPQTITDPAFLHAMHALINDAPGERCAIALYSWAKVAPVGWGADIADALMSAVRRGTCPPAVAAVLIGPRMDLVMQQCDPYAAAFVVRRWGQAEPNNPTWWTAHVSKEERKGVLDLLKCNTLACASCLPWLPSSVIKRCIVSPVAIAEALDAFALASSHERMRHADHVAQIVERAQSLHLGALTRLACAGEDESIWTRILTLLQKEPDAAGGVVVSAPWDHLPHDVQMVILGNAAHSKVCAAVAAARGARSLASIPHDILDVFFGSLDPDVWDDLHPQTQRRLLQHLSEYHAHLAVRSLGLRPEILVRTRCYNELVVAAQCHTTDHATLRWRLLPVALRRSSPSALHALIGALPTMPPDAGAFFSIACGRNDADIVSRARTALRTPADLALAVAIQRCADFETDGATRKKMLVGMLRGRTWSDVQPICAILDDHARRMLAPNVDALAQRLSRPERLDQMRTALARLASLPLDVGIPSLFALEQGIDPVAGWDMVTEIVNNLRNHGDVYLHIVDASPDERARCLLPLPTDPRLANALRDLARDDVAHAYQIAFALENDFWRDALYGLLTAPLRHADAIWNALSPEMQRDIEWRLCIETSSDTKIATVAAAIAEKNEPVAALALRAVQSHDSALQSAGASALHARTHRLRIIWRQAPPSVRSIFFDIPLLSIAVADLSDKTPHAACAPRSGRCRRQGRQQAWREA